MVYKSVGLLLLVWMSAGQLCAQMVVKGRVIDQSSKEPLAAAVVMSPTDTAITNASGAFSLAAIDFPVQIEVRHIGYLAYKRMLSSSNDEFTIGLIPSSLALNEVVIQASTQGASIKNSSAGISIVSKDMIQRDDPFTTVASLNRVPGVYMHSGTYNTSRLTIRGIGSRSLFGTNKIKAYYGDIPLTDGSGNTMVEDIDQGMIDRMEVHKGPNSSLYGAGLAGVVILRPHQPASNTTTIEQQLTVGDFNTSRYMGRLSHHDDRKSFTATYSNTESRGYRDNSSYSREQIGLLGKIDMASKGQISLLGFYSQLTSFIPSAINFNDYTNRPKVAATTWAVSRGYVAYDKAQIGLNYTSSWQGNWKLSTTVFGGFRDAYEPRPFNILEENTQSLGMRSIGTFKAAGTTWSIGTELFSDVYRWGTLQNLYTPTSQGSVPGSRLSKYREARQYYNVFTELNQQLGDMLMLTAGLNVNNTSYTLEDQFPGSNIDRSGDYQFTPVVSPRLGLNLPLGSHAKVFSNISHGFSPPALSETLYPDGQINPNIKPEMGWNFESGIRGNYKRLNYDITGYFMKISNLIVAQRSADDAYIGVNAGLNHHLGADIAINYFIEPFKGHQVNFFTTVGLAHYKFVKFVNQDRDYSGNWLTGMPKTMVNPGVEWLSEFGFYGNITGQFVSQIPIYDDNSLYADAYNVLRGKLGYRVKLGKLTLDGHLGVNNLADEKYASMLLINATAVGNAQPRIYYPGMPRHFYGGVWLKYEFK